MQSSPARTHAITHKRTHAAVFLAIDVGNSAVKGGLFDGTELGHVFSVSAGADGAWADALAPHLGDVSVEGVGIASVVPETTEAVTDALRRYTDASPVHVRPTMPLPFRLDYETPDTLGMDRLAAAAAGWTQYGRRADPARSVIVVDAGTAVTGEVVHRDGIYQGGVIAAGPALVRRALRGGTAQLPEVLLELPADPVGDSTQSAIQSGIMWGFVDLVRGMTDRLAGTLPDEPIVVLTGGWSALLADHLDAVNAVTPHLVLEGVHVLTAGDDGGSM
jgi:type III pantothenate kinase